MNWAERQQRVKDDMLRGQGKHEAMLLKCKLREQRGYDSNSFQMKSIDREMKKIESELSKIRHTIRYRRRNSGALTTRSLTFDTITPRRRKPGISHENMLLPADGSTSPCSKRGSRSRLSVSPSMMASVATSLPEISTAQEQSSLLSLPLPEIVTAQKRNSPQMSAKHSGISRLREIQEEAINSAHTDDTYSGGTVNPSLPVPEIATAQKRASPQESIYKSVMPRLREIHEEAMKNTNTEDVFVGENASVNLTDHNIPTISITRQPTFTHQPKSIGRKRKQSRSRLNALSSGNFNSIRDVVANETLKKFGLG